MDFAKASKFKLQNLNLIREIYLIDAPDHAKIALYLHAISKYDHNDNYYHYKHH